MGLFTNICASPHCDHRVRKGSKFCPKCGAGAPHGLATCGGCGKEVKITSKFCWNCGKDLADVAAPKFTSNRWDRRPEDFAVRIDPVDLKGWLLKPLIIEHGTRALLFQNGKLAGELDEGRYDVDGFMARFTNFFIDKAASAVVMDAGDITIDLENGDLWTADPFEVGTTSRLVLRLVNPEAMFVNLVKERSRITLDDLECELAGEVQMLLSGIVACYQADRLFSGLDGRSEIETQLRNHLTTTCERLGLALVQLRFIDFCGEAFEKWRRMKADLQADEKKADLDAQRAQLNQRVRETLTQEKMDEFKNEKDLESFIRQTEHELDLKDVIRDDEMRRLKDRFLFERDREALLRRLEIQGIDSTEKREQAWKDLLADERSRDEVHRRDLERQLGMAKNKAEIRRIELEIERLEHEEDERQAEWGIIQLQKVKDIEYEEDRRRVELERQTLEQRSKATAEALISITDGPGGQHIRELEELRRKQSLTPEQILALAAATSSSAAQTLAEHYKATGKLSQDVKDQLEQRLAEQREISGSHADRIEALTRMALEQMGGVATTRARPAESTQTVVTPGGMGAPVVIHAGSCRYCQAPVDREGSYCPECGKKQ